MAEPEQSGAEGIPVAVNGHSIDLDGFTFVCENEECELEEQAFTVIRHAAANLDCPVEKRRAWQTSGSILGGEVAEVDPESVPLPESSLSGAEREDDPKERVDIATADDGGLEQADLDQWGEA